MQAMRSMIDSEPTTGDAPLIRPLTPLTEATFAAPSEEAAGPAQQICYERGGVLQAIDGPVGTLRQVVIDEEAAEVKALVVRLTSKKESVLVPPDLIAASLGSTLLLNVTTEQFMVGARRSPRMEPRMFTRADLKRAAHAIPAAFRGDRQRSLVRLGKNAVATSDHLAPTPTPAAPRPGRSLPALFRRQSAPSVEATG